MTFPRVNPGSWAVNDKLTSTQQNQLDIDHANAVDKTGDTISGTVNLAGFGKISANIHDSCISTVDAGISTNVARGISINNDTGLVLEGATCWPSFRTTRAYYDIIDPRPQPGVTGWNLSNYALTGPASVDQAVIFFRPHHGSTITTIDVVFNVGVSHASVPAVLPKIGVKRVNDADIALVGAAPAGTVDLYSGGQATFVPTPGTGASWYASGNKQTWSVTCDQNNVVDRTKYRYFIQLIDENGANSASGNLYYSFRINYTAIPNMQFR